MNSLGQSGRFFLLPVVALLASATALAQMQNGAGAQQQAPSPSPSQATSQQMPGQAADPNAGNGASFADQAFVKEIMESDATEVQLGQLAQQKSQSDDVKQLGQSMVTNRTRLDQQLQPTADKLSVGKPKGPSKKDKQLMAKLDALSGPEFDQEYIQVVAKANQKDVKDFKSEAEAAQDPNLQQAAKADSGVLEQHQQAVERIAESHNIALDAKK
jgi:putative membrane protein